MLSVFVLLAGSLCGAEPELQFRVKFSARVQAEPYTGRLYVMTGSANGSREPRLGPDWFRPSPFFALDVVDLKPGQAAVLASDALGFPGPIATLKPGSYRVQAVLDRNLGHRDFSDSEGNGYSNATTVELDPKRPIVVNFLIDQIVGPQSVRDSDRVRLVDFPSKLVSAFAKREVHLKASVVLPPSYAKETTRKYPVYYSIPGFGGTHRVGPFGSVRSVNDGEEFIVVHLNPECPLGHHVFADSDNNGPYGRALVEELIPHIETTYRAVNAAGARYVGGHSSGGWSSLWLQVAYPDTFGGVWSTSPDPVDFRDFQQIDLYKPGENMFTDETGKPRPIARRGTTPVVFYKAFSDMEVVMGHGGQLGSFEAVFSPRMPDGKPRPLWDRKTGAVDTATAKTWEKYDIRLKLEREWPTLAPKLAGKIHCYMGDLDTFYLEGAVRLLKESLAKLGSDAKVELFPGKDHGSIMDGALRARISKEMADQYRKHAKPK